MGTHNKYNHIVYSFTLIELMIVIAILAALTVFVVLVIQPNKLIAQANDSRRVTEIGSIVKAIEYIAIWAPDFDYGNANTVYISLPDSSPTCSSYSLPVLPSGYTYACKSIDNYQKVDGNGWIPIDFRAADLTSPLRTLPIDPINNIDYYYSYNPGGSYEINAFFQSDKYLNSVALNDGGDSFNTYERGYSLTDMPNVFPRNWIKVPGDSLYGTSDFWVMQFEAKYSKSGKGADDANTCRSAGHEQYDTWDWGKTGTDCPSSWSNTNVVFSPYGSPIAGVTHNEAKAICASLGAHLITNQEWMTIARNAAVQKQNWTSNPQVVGTGYLYNGNSGDSARGYKAFSDRYDADKGVNRNPRAILTLSNNSKIYDFSGNVWEHMMKDINDTLVQITPSDGGGAGWRWIEMTAITDYGSLSYDEIRPSNNTWNADKGMGRIYTYNGSYADRVLLRGGRWDNGSNAGSFAMITSWSAGNQYSDVGFRCAR